MSKDIEMKFSKKATQLKQTTEVQEAMAVLRLQESEVLCKFVNESSLTGRGTYLQFVSLNSNGSATMIGGIRVELRDIRKVPQYLSQNKPLIWQHCAEMLHQHLLGTQCPAAVNEMVTYEDFSISYGLATVSEEGARVNPMGRNEGHFSTANIQDSSSQQS